MDEKRYLIGEVSKITGISKDTLRFWDKIGLLKPRYVDPRNNYRYYTYDQFWSIDVISCCRSLDIPIDTIRSILSSNSNEKVMELLLEQQKKAKQRSQYYRQVVEDISWYDEQSRMIKESAQESSVTVRRYPERAVLYGRNSEDTRAYHLKLQELCLSAVGNPHTIRRGYGFLLDSSRMRDNAFIKKGEYIRFDKEILKEADPQYLTWLPGGEYACCIVRVTNNTADFSVLNDWLRRRQVQPRFVAADEIGLQLFEYLDHGYLCEVKVLLE